MALPFDVDDATPLLGMDPDVGVRRNKESEHHHVLRVFGVGWVRDPPPTPHAEPPSASDVYRVPRERSFLVFLSLT
jgi:hypothetical protein